MRHRSQSWAESSLSSSVWGLGSAFVIFIAKHSIVCHPWWSDNRKNCNNKSHITIINQYLMYNRLVICEREKFRGHLYCIQQKPIGNKKLEGLNLKDINVWWEIKMAVCFNHTTAWEGIKAKALVYSLKFCICWGIAWICSVAVLLILKWSQ